jgi:hypothetical protein
MADDPIDIPRLRRIVSREWAVIAWPRRPSGAPMPSDVFEGLD